MRHSELVEYTLPACTVAVAVACDTLVHVVVVDLGVEERFYSSFVAELGVVDFVSRFDELGHAYAEDVGGGGGFLSHDRGLVVLVVSRRGLSRWQTL